MTETEIHDALEHVRLGIQYYDRQAKHEQLKRIREILQRALLRKQESVGCAAKNHLRV